MFNGLCAYSGTPLEEDWQVDHVKPIIRNPFSKEPLFKKDDNIENMVPCQKIINHYKGNLDLETFRKWFLMGLSERMKKLPKNPTARKSIKRKEYLAKVAQYFGITPDKPFDGTFYFERVGKKLFIKTDLTDEPSHEEQN